MNVSLPKHPTRRQPVAFLIPAVFALCMALGGPALAQAPSPVRVDTVRLEPVQQRRAVTGEIRAVRRSLVASQEEGVLSSLLVAEGDRVERGQVLAGIDAQRLNVILAGREADLRASQAMIAQRNAELSVLTRDVERLQKAVRSGAANEKELLDAQSGVSAAQAAIAEAQSVTASIEAAIELLQIRLNDMTIRAPYAGVVVGREAEIGEWVDSGDAVVELLQTDPLEAWLDVPQQLLGAVLSSREPIEVHDAGSGAVIARAPGRVIPLVDERARTFSLVVTVANAEGDYAPGVAITGSAPTGELVERLTIDRDAIMRGETGPYVYVMRSDAGGAPATAQIAPIAPLFDFQGRLVIEFGALREGDRIVVEGNERLYPTAPIVAVEPGQDGTATAGGAPQPPSAGG
ncbi:MAG: efflux RND transporter periplasmic adaptor subunit [Phycisphaeraceae bacterium]|nr:efflux RND transporter periplasmic adaptor subunit [Phycisphaeraceae bacterium]